MKIAPQSNSEKERIETLLSYEILDTEFETTYDELTQLASSICGTPIALISLIDEHRQWFKAKVGLEVRETNRDIAFCSYAILQHDVLVIEDATKDERFCDNPLVIEAPHIRFYAGAPLITSSGFSLGTLCVIDTKPKRFSEQQIKSLKILAKQVSAQLDLRLSFKKLQEYTKQLKQLNSSKDKFFSIIAHDLKSPFNSMLGFAQILENDVEKLKTEQIKEISSEIYHTGKATFRLLENLLQWSMLEIGNLPWKPQKVNLADAVKEVLSLLSGVASQKNISLMVDIPPKDFVYADATMLKSVIQNLVNNALKFTPSGGKVTVTSMGDDEHFTRLIINDTGVGMTQSQIDQLFDMEYSTSREGTEGEKGTGLGLLLCREFVIKNGGTITVESLVGKGSQFSFTIPKI